jgi:hypothetical protein
MSLAPVPAPSPLTNVLAQIGVPEMLETYVPRQHVTRRVSWAQFERFVQSHGYEVKRENGNIYGKLMLVPTSSVVAPVMRLITRSDHAAVYGGAR